MLKNIGSNWLLMLATAAAVYVLTPFVIGEVGAAAYGVWLVIGSLCGYLYLIRGGVPASSVRSFSHALAKPDNERGLNAAIASSLAVYLIQAALVFVAGVVLFGVFEFAFDIPAAIRPQARIAFIIVVVQIGVNFPGRLPLTVMEAHDDFVPKNLVQFGSLLVRFTLTIVLLSIEASLALLATALLAQFIVEFIVGVIVIKRLYPPVRVRLALAERDEMKGIAKTGAAILIIMLGGQLAYRTDTLVIGAFLKMEDVSIYGLANNLTQQMIELILAISAVVMPRATKLMAAAEHDELRGLTLRWSKIALTLMLAPGIYLLVLGQEFISWWINPELGMPAGEILWIILPSFFLFFPARGVAEPVMVASGKLRIPATAALLSGVVNLGISIALVKPLGLHGVAIGTAVPTAVLAVLLIYLACNEVGLSTWAYLRYVVVKNTLGAAPAVGFLLWCKYQIEPRGFVSLFAIGIAMLVIYGTCCALFVYRNDPHLDPIAKFRQIYRRLRRNRG